MVLLDGKDRTASTTWKSESPLDANAGKPGDVVAVCDVALVPAPAPVPVPALAAAAVGDDGEGIAVGDGGDTLVCSLRCGRGGGGGLGGGIAAGREVDIHTERRENRR